MQRVLKKLTYPFLLSNSQMISPKAIRNLASNLNIDLIFKRDDKMTPKPKYTTIDSLLTHLAQKVARVRHTSKWHKVRTLERDLQQTYTRAFQFSVRVRPRTLARYLVDDVRIYASG